jgi:hypothetical protein
MVSVTNSYDMDCIEDNASNNSLSLRVYMLLR